MSKLAEQLEFAFSLLGDRGTILKDDSYFVLCEVTFSDERIRDAFFAALERVFYIDFFAERGHDSYFSVEELNPIPPFREKGILLKR